jgi:hypothetical protein
MAKDLPYFKFFCSEWSDGDITLETYEMQGIFINICSYYWSNECVLELSKLKKRFRNDIDLIDLLIKNDLLKQISGFIKISFLDEQKFEREEQSKIKSKGGKASAEARKLIKIQHNVNTTSTENQHVLNSCSTESQLLREEKIRKDKRREENIINNNSFVSECKNSSQWIEVTAIQNKITIDIVKIFIDTFETHLITMQEQKKTVKEYKEHFTHWMKKQDLSNFRKSIIGKTNQI